MYLAIRSSQSYKNDTKTKTIVKFSKSLNIESAFTRMASEIENILEVQKFSKLRRACVQRVNSLGSNLPQSLATRIKDTDTLDDLLDLFSESPYWNWFDTRLLQALVSASGSPEAEEWLERFKAAFYTKKVTEVIPYISIKPFKESITIVEKFDKDPKELTISELLEHKYKLEYEVLDINGGELVLSCIKTGCVELTWQLPQELVYRAYTSMKRKHDELSSLAIKSLVCEEADEYAGLPILWRGQEVGEVGPIEPLPGHVRQEPYSLPQGFHWVTVSSNNVEEADKFIRRNKNTTENYTQFIVHYLTYPNTRNDTEWQFGIRTTDGKLVGVLLSAPLHIHVGKDVKIFIIPSVYCHKKYRNKRLKYLLIKELMRRANLSKINQLITVHSPLFKPVATLMVWAYALDQPTSSLLPSSPRTPGWRRMTSEDVPSALALIKKWSSQFEIRQVLNEEEFVYGALMQNNVITYVVEDKLNNVTDLVSYMSFDLFSSADDMSNDLPTGATGAAITTLVSTQSPVKQLIIDALVCARENGALAVTIHQYNIKKDILTSLSFQLSHYETYHFYNYGYHEISQNEFWTFNLSLKFN